MQLQLLSGGAAHGLVQALAGRFTDASGYAIKGEYGAVGAIGDKLAAGAAADLVILTAGVIADLTARGLVRAGTAVDIGAVYTGIAVRAGDPAPAVRDATALRAALRAADAIYFPDPARATAGIHFAKVMRQLGLESELAARVRTFPNGAAGMAAMAAQQGGRPIGCTQVTEILGTPGVELVANLPHEFELVTTYTAAVSTSAAHPEAARLLAEMLTGPAASADRDRAGFVAP